MIKHSTRHVEDDLFHSWQCRKQVHNENNIKRWFLEFHLILNFFVCCNKSSVPIMIMMKENNMMHRRRIQFKKEDGKIQQHDSKPLNYH